jgi:hypothetical protein
VIVIVAVVTGGMASTLSLPSTSRRSFTTLSISNLRQGLDAFTEGLGEIYLKLSARTTEAATLRDISALAARCQLSLTEGQLRAFLRTNTDVRSKMYGSSGAPREMARAVVGQQFLECKDARTAKARLAKLGADISAPEVFRASLAYSGAVTPLGLISFVLKELATDEERNAIDALLLLHMRSDGTWSDGHAKLTETLLRFAKLSISGRGPTERRNAPQ